LRAVADGPGKDAMTNLLDNVPTAMMQRRHDVRHHLAKLTKLLAADMPESERKIAQKRFEALRQEANAMGIEF
jgi:hypothetical protein